MRGERDDPEVVWGVEGCVNVSQHLGEEWRVEGVIWVLGMLVSLGGSQMEMEVLVGE